MGKATITISGKGLQDVKTLDMEIWVEAVVNIDARAARRTATEWLVGEVGNMLLAGDPRLVIAESTVWRIPIKLTSSQTGVLGEVGFVDVDAATGVAHVSPAQISDILKNVNVLIRPAPSSTG